MERMLLCFCIDQSPVSMFVFICVLMRASLKQLGSAVSRMHGTSCQRDVIIFNNAHSTYLNNKSNHRITRNFKNTEIFNLNTEIFNLNTESLIIILRIFNNNTENF